MAAKMPNFDRRPLGQRLARLLAALARPRTAVMGLAATLPLLSGCNLRQVLGWDMYNQPKAKVYRASDFFEDKQSARPLVAGTVPRSEVYVDRNSTGIPVAYIGDSFPPDLFGPGDAIEPEKLKAVLDRGQTVFNVYCAVCHGRTGKADGMIVQRGFTPPPSFVIPPETDPERKALEADKHRWERTQFLQTAPPSHFYDAISNGFGAMYSYGERVKPEDRWKVIAYIKALQSNPSKPIQKTAAELEEDAKEAGKVDQRPFHLRDKPEFAR